MGRLTFSDDLVERLVTDTGAGEALPLLADGRLAVGIDDELVVVDLRTETTVLRHHLRVLSVRWRCRSAVTGPSRPPNGVRASRRPSRAGRLLLGVVETCSTPG